MGKYCFLYHRINEPHPDLNRISVSVDNFKNHLDLLEKSFRLVSMKEYIDYQGNGDIATITFDDGFEDFYYNVQPILNERDIPSTVFIATGNIDSNQELWTTEILWLLYENGSGFDNIRFSLNGEELHLPIGSVKQRAMTYSVLRNILMKLDKKSQDAILREIRDSLKIPFVERIPYRVMSSNQIKEISHNELVTIGAHTVSHVSLGQISLEEAECEIKKSINKLKMITDQEVDIFAYPFGGRNDHNVDNIKTLMKAGVSAAFTINGVSDNPQLFKYQMPRIYVGNWDLDRMEKQIREWKYPHNLKMSDKHSNVVYLGPIENDTKLSRAKKIVIWGTKDRGQYIYKYIKKEGLESRIIGFGDNDPNMSGKDFMYLPVLNMKEVSGMKDVTVILWNRHDVEIVRQMKTFGSFRIHWIIQ